MTENEIIDLIAELKNATLLYNHTMGTSPLTDEEYDMKMEALAEVFDGGEFPHLFERNTDGAALMMSDYAVGDGEISEAVTHDVPMMSLGKAKSVEELKTYVKRVKAAGGSKFKVQSKLDGFAVSVRYVNGNLIHLATRGVGKVGENITYLKREKSLTIVGIPDTVNTKETIDVRGEMFLTDWQFKKLSEGRTGEGGESFKNPRNAVSGTMKRAKLGLSYPAEMTFGSYSLIVNDEMRNLDELTEYSDQFKTIHEITKNSCPRLKIDNLDENELFDTVQKFGALRATFDYPTDGIVVKPVNEGELYGAMGYTSHHPVSQIAFKYPGVSATSKIVGMNVTVGGTGKLTPVAEIQPVEVDGSVIRYVTCNNFNWIAERGIKVGSTVTVTKANDVIPYISAVVGNPDDATEIPVPTECPYCSSILKVDSDAGVPKTLICENVDCSSRSFNSFVTALKRTVLDIDGMGENVARSLFDAGVLKDVSDLFNLTVDSMKDYAVGYTKDGNPIKIGESRAKNIVDHIEKSRTLPLNRWLMALGVPRLGNSMSRMFAREFGTIDRVMNLTVDDLVGLEGVQLKTAETIVKGLANRVDLVERLKGHGVTFGSEAATGNSDGLAALEGGNDSTSVVEGLSFSISGGVPEGFDNRDGFVEWLESNGAEFHSAPKGGTNYMIGDPNGTSSKLAKARKNGTEIITADQFVSKFMNCW